MNREERERLGPEGVKAVRSQGASSGSGELVVRVRDRTVATRETFTDILRRMYTKAIESTLYGPAHSMCGSFRIVRLDVSSRRHAGRLASRASS